MGTICIDHGHSRATASPGVLQHHRYNSRGQNITSEDEGSSCVQLGHDCVRIGAGTGNAPGRTPCEQKPVRLTIQSDKLNCRMRQAAGTGRSQGSESSAEEWRHPPCPWFCDMTCGIAMPRGPSLAQRYFAACSESATAGTQDSQNLRLQLFNVLHSEFHGTRRCTALHGFRTVHAFGCHSGWHEASPRDTVRHEDACRVCESTKPSTMPCHRQTSQRSRRQNALAPQDLLQVPLFYSALLRYSCAVFSSYSHPLLARSIALRPAQPRHIRAWKQINMQQVRSNRLSAKN